jgi:hypothetical protein
MKNFEDLAQQKFGGDREAYNKFEEYRNQESLRFVRENKVEICDSNRIAFINILNARVNDLEVYFVSRPFGTE